MAKIVRRKILLLMMIVVVFAMASCGKKEEQETAAPEETVAEEAVEEPAEKVEEPAGTTTEKAAEVEMDAYTLLTEKFGIPAELLEGLDIDALVRDYRLDKESYTSEEILEFIEDTRDYYTITPEDEVFAVLGTPSDVPEDGPDLPKDAEVVKIAIYENPGTLQKRVVYDLENGKYYVDDATPHQLTEEQTTSLKNLAKEADVPSWEHKYKRTGLTETTASYAWKIVFVLSDGTQYVYGGYTEDMSNLPAELELLTYVSDSIAYPE